MTSIQYRGVPYLCGYGDGLRCIGNAVVLQLEKLDPRVKVWQLWTGMNALEFS